MRSLDRALLRPGGGGPGAADATGTLDGTVAAGGPCRCLMAYLGQVAVTTIEKLPEPVRVGAPFFPFCVTVTVKW